MFSRLFKKSPSEFLLNDPNWPLATPDYMICRTEQQKLSRSLIISEWAGNEYPILDFGCGDGKVVEILNRQSIEAFGYEINQNWSDVTSKSYKTVLMHDVIDHMFEDRVKWLIKIRNILFPNGKLKIRCHPWCSRHGGHQVAESNKAFAHLVYPNKWTTDKNIDPVTNYENLFKFSGFRIISKIAHRRTIEDWILANLSLYLFSYWPENMWKGKDCPAILPYLDLEYIDYELYLGIK